DSRYQTLLPFRCPRPNSSDSSRGQRRTVVSFGHKPFLRITDSVALRCRGRFVSLHPTPMSHPIHLILSPGTRIVTRNDANRIGGGQLIAAGAVAVITDSPADAQHAYKVRCNDGAEAMLRRNEFSILKEFKDVPGGRASPRDPNIPDQSGSRQEPRPPGEVDRNA